MNILIWSSVFYPAVGGIENLTALLATEFVKAGHTVKVITEQPQDASKPLPEIEVLHVSDAYSNLKYFLWSDVFYMANITLKGVWLLLFDPRKKWVVSHNDFHLSHTRDWKTDLKKTLISRANANICVSRSVADSLNVQSTVIHNCYDETIFKIYPDEVRCFDFLFVGRLVSQKGCDLLIEACKGLNGPFTLNIVGEGAEYEKLQAQVDESKLGDRIKFLGVLERESLARVMNQHRAMIVPSRSAEGFGIVALEGLACGCKMLVSDAGGLREAIAGFADVFPMGDVDKLHDLLLTNLEPDGGANSMSSRKMQFLVEHSRQSVATKYLDIFSASPEAV